MGMYLSALGDPWCLDSHITKDHWDWSPWLWSMTLNVSKLPWNFGSKYRYFLVSRRHVGGHRSRPWCLISVILFFMAIWTSRSFQYTNIHAHRGWSASTVTILGHLEAWFSPKSQNACVGAVSTRKLCRKEIMRPLFRSNHSTLPQKSVLRFCLRRLEGTQMDDLYFNQFFFYYKYPDFEWSPWAPIGVVLRSESRNRIAMQPSLRLCAWKMCSGTSQNRSICDLGASRPKRLICSY